MTGDWILRIQYIVSTDASERDGSAYIGSIFVSNSSAPLESHGNGLHEAVYYITSRLPAAAVARAHVSPHNSGPIACLKHITQTQIR